MFLMPADELEVSLENRTFIELYNLLFNSHFQEAHIKLENIFFEHKNHYLVYGAMTIIQPWIEYFQDSAKYWLDITVEMLDKAGYDGKLLTNKIHTEAFAQESCF